MKNKRFIKYIFTIISLFLSFSMLSNCKKECNHSSVNKTIIVQPTCTENGKFKVTCNKCEAIFEETIGALGHDYIWTTVVEPTCHSKGFSTAICRRNKEHENEMILDKVNHLYTNYVSNNDASLTKEGTKTAYCDFNCGSSDTIIDEGSMFDDFKNDTFFVEGLKKSLNENYTLKFDNVSIIENSSLSSFYSSELFLTIKEDQLFGYGKGTKYDSFNAQGPYKNFISEYYVISNGYFYLVEVSNGVNNSIIKYSLDNIFIEGTQIHKFYVTNYNKFISNIKNLNEKIDENPIFYNDLIKKIATDFFNVYKVGSTYNFRLNSLYLNNFIEKLKTENFSITLDYYLGENSLSNIQNKLNFVLNRKVKDLLKSDNYEIKTVLDDLDTFISLISLNKYQTLEEFLLAEYKIDVFDLNNIFDLPKYSNYKLVDLIALLNNTSVLAISTYLDELFLFAKNNTFEAFYNQYLTFGENNFSNKSKDLIDDIKNYYSLLITTDKEGVISSIQFDTFNNDEKVSCEIMLGYDETFNYEEIILLADIINNISINESSFSNSNYQLIYNGEKLEKIIEEKITYQDYSNVIENEDYYQFNATKVVTKTTHILLNDNHSIKYDFNENKYYLIVPTSIVEINKSYVLVKYNDINEFYDEEFINDISKEEIKEFYNKIQIAL